MSNINVTIRMDEDLKKEADALFAELGVNLSTAFNIFVRQAVRLLGGQFDWGGRLLKCNGGAQRLAQLGW